MKKFKKLAYLKDIVFCIVLIIVIISAIPYAIVRGVCNIKYYEEWADFIFKYLNPQNKK